MNDQEIKIIESCDSAEDIKRQERKELYSFCRYLRQNPEMLKSSDFQKQVNKFKRNKLKEEEKKEEPIKEKEKEKEKPKQKKSKSKPKPQLKSKRKPEKIRSLKEKPKRKPKKKEPIVIPPSSDSCAIPSDSLIIS